MIAYKFLRPDGSSVFTSFRWPLPDDEPGAWVDARAVPCRSGVHACRVEHVPLWAGRILYAIELDGEVVEEPSKLVAARGRLLHRVPAWEEGVRDAFTRASADRAHELTRSGSLDAWEAVIEPSVPEGPALLSFVAARIAEELGGVEAYRAERAAQTAWLLERLGPPRA